MIFTVVTILGSVLTWLFMARANYRYFMQRDVLRSFDVTTPENPVYRDISNCPNYMKSWHKVSQRCATCGDVSTDWAATRTQRAAVALVAGPVLGLLLMLRGAVTVRQPVQKEERSDQIARLESVLAEATRALEKAQEK